MKKLLRIALAVFLVILAAAGAADRAALSEESNDPSRRFPLATYTPAPSPTPKPTPSPAASSVPDSGTVRKSESSNQAGYRIILDDSADLLSPEEEERLLETMQQLSQYGHVIFWTTDRSTSDTLLSLQKYVDENIGKSTNIPSISFVINMSSRKLYLLTRGNIEANVSSSDANEITERNSSLAKKKQYGECAAAVFSDVYNAIHGIYEFPAMRVICGVLFGLSIALLIIFLYTQKISLQQVDSQETTLTINRSHRTRAQITKDEITRSTKVRIKTSSSSSSSSCSSCSSCSSGSSCSSCSSGSSCSSCGSGGGSSF